MHVHDLYKRGSGCIIDNYSSSLYMKYSLVSKSIHAVRVCTGGRDR